MKWMNIGLLTGLFLFAQVSISFAEKYSLEELTGENAPATMIGWVVDIDLERGKILMGDTGFRFRDDTLYLSVDDRPTDKNSFTKNIPVRFLSKGRDIIAIWHVDDPEDEYRPKEQRTKESKGPPPIEPVVADPSELDGVIKKQNGVWTN